MQENRQAFQETGMNGFVAKPATEQALEQAMATAMGGAAICP